MKCFRLSAFLALGLSGVLPAWYAAGEPDQVNAPAVEKHWAFQAPKPTVVPGVRNPLWVQTPMDAFILADLEASRLEPAPPADRRTLIRRATFDLTGMPPTPEEISEFLADNSPAAFARVVERLLASPRYGQRWGRHWLDVARYADSNGLDENVAQGNAWRYRDYVVKSFNDDLPFNEFVREQLAGDLLPSGDEATRHRRLIATGFLALGPKVLAEPDERKMEMDIVDEQIDAMGRSLMALTLGCARCHDHKFDPLSTEDYYGLSGIFLSTRTMETFKKVARWQENSLASAEAQARKQEHDAKIAQAKESIKTLIRQADGKVKASAAPGKELPKNLESLYPEEAKSTLKRLRDEASTLEKAAPVLPSAMGVSEGKTTEAAVLRRGNHQTPGKIVSRRFPTILAGSGASTLPDRQSGRLELANWLVQPNHPLTSRVLVNRVWRWHFGQGLVRSVDNFGLLGEKPANPQLLDWLADHFVNSGWSIKSLHRLILLSSTYQMSTTYDARAAGLDPDNRRHWRMNIRRLEAEAIRDSLLAVGGILDQKMGGSLLHVKNREYLFDHTSKDGTRYDSLRASIYLPVIRNNLYDVFQLFDATDATVINGDRSTTTVATQALFSMNSPLVLQASENLATRVLQLPAQDDTARLQWLYETAYGRPPTQRELNRCIAALANFEEQLRPQESAAEERRRRVWSLLCHVIVSANEFVTVN